jgi:hypothetical protein
VARQLTRDDPPAAATDRPSVLDGILTPADHLTATSNGVLCVDGCDARAFLEEFCSQLFVISERTLRENYRRFRAAVVKHWPWAPVNVLYAINANNNLMLDGFARHRIPTRLRSAVGPAAS